jgi:hypothetical protein
MNYFNLWEKKRNLVDKAIEISALYTADLLRDEIAKIDGDNTDDIEYFELYTRYSEKLDLLQSASSILQDEIQSNMKYLNKKGKPKYMIEKTTNEIQKYSVLYQQISECETYIIQLKNVLFDILKPKMIPPHFLTDDLVVR